MIPETTIHFSELAKQPGINQWTAITVNETHLGLLLLGEDIEEIQKMNTETSRQSTLQTYLGSS